MIDHLWFMRSLARDVWPFLTSLAASLWVGPLAWRLAILGGYVMASSMWTFKFVRPQPAGVHRLVSALPVLIGHSLVPMWVTAEEEPLAITTYVLASGLSVMKVIAFFCESGITPSTVRRTGLQR